LGVPLAPDTPLAFLLAREAGLDPALLVFRIVSPEGSVLLSSPGHPPEATLQQALLARTPIRDDLGRTVAWAQVRYDDTALRTARGRLEQALWQALVPALLIVCTGLAAWYGWLLRRPRRSAGSAASGERTRLVLGAVVLLGMALLWMGWRATVAGQGAIVPDQIAKAQAVARSSAALVARALEAGIPADRLVGLSAPAEAVRAHSPEIAALSVVAPDGRVLAGPALQPGPWTVAAPVQVQGHGAAP